MLRNLSCACSPLPTLYSYNVYTLHMRFVQICAQRFKLNVLITFGCTQTRCCLWLRVRNAECAIVLAAGKCNGPCTAPETDDMTPGACRPPYITYLLKSVCSLYFTYLIYLNSFSFIFSWHAIHTIVFNYGRCALNSAWYVQIHKCNGCSVSVFVPIC